MPSPGGCSGRVPSQLAASRIPIVIAATRTRKSTTATSAAPSAIDRLCGPLTSTSTAENVRPCRCVGVSSCSVVDMPATSGGTPRPTSTSPPTATASTGTTSSPMPTATAASPAVTAWPAPSRRTTMAASSPPTTEPAPKPRSSTPRNAGEWCSPWSTTANMTTSMNPITSIASATAATICRSTTVRRRWVSPATTSARQCPSAGTGAGSLTRSSSRPPAATRNVAASSSATECGPTVA